MKKQCCECGKEILHKDKCSRTEGSINQQDIHVSFYCETCSIKQFKECEKRTLKEHLKELHDVGYCNGKIEFW